MIRCGLSSTARDVPGLLLPPAADQCSGLASAAKQMGKYVGKLIAARVAGQRSLVGGEGTELVRKGGAMLAPKTIHPHN